MKSQHTPISSSKGIKISEETRRLYELRDKSLDSDPDAAPLPPEKWANAMRREEFLGECFRPVKKQMTVRIDADVVRWLKGQGEGHLTRINQILRDAMTADVKARVKKMAAGAR